MNLMRGVGHRGPDAENQEGMSWSRVSGFPVQGPNVSRSWEVDVMAEGDVS